MGCSDFLKVQTVKLRNYTLHIAFISNIPSTLAHHTKHTSTLSGYKLGVRGYLLYPASIVLKQISGFPTDIYKRIRYYRIQLTLSLFQKPIHKCTACNTTCSVNQQQQLNCLYINLLPQAGGKGGRMSY